MDFLFLLFMTFAFIMVVNYIDRSIQARTSVSGDAPEKRCPPHRWTQRDNSAGGHYLWCPDCKITPSVTTRDDDKPY